jgi:hypothetical protein
MTFTFYHERGLINILRLQSASGNEQQDAIGTVLVDNQDDEAQHLSEHDQGNETIAPNGSCQEFGCDEVARCSAAGFLFKNVYFSVRESPVAGLGAFACRELKKGDIILEEKPLFESNLRHLFRDFEALGSGTKSAVLSLHQNEQAQLGTSTVENVWRTNW